MEKPILSAKDKRGIEMNREEIDKYYKAYNNCDFEEMAKHYTDDCIFESKNMKANGKEIIGYFRLFRDYFDEILTPVNILIEGDKIAVEMDNYIKARKDGGEYLKKIYKAGDLVADRRVAVFYTLRRNKICNIKVYTFE